MANQRIWKNCAECDSTGVQYQDASGNIQSIENDGDIEVECPTCLGVKRTHWGWLEVE